MKEETITVEPFILFPISVDNTSDEVRIVLPIRVEKLEETLFMLETITLDTVIVDPMSDEKRVELAFMVDAITVEPVILFAVRVDI